METNFRQKYIACDSSSKTLQTLHLRSSRGIGGMQYIPASMSNF